MPIQAGMSDSDDSPSVSPALKLAVTAVMAVGLGALGFTWYTYQHQQTLVQSEADARLAQIATLQHELNRLRGSDSSTAKRVQAIQTKQGDLAPLAKRVLKSVFTVIAGRELGTGFVGWQDSSSSYLITARHVVVNDLGGYVTLERASGGSWQGEIMEEDAKNDLAVIRLDGFPAGAAPLWQNPHTARPLTGDSLLLVGSPYGLSGTVTNGIVSRVTSDVIQTDAAANPGNSGGPAVDQQGNIVGVVLSRIDPKYGSGLTFAVPIDRVCQHLRHC
ncbi:MAG TPA: trypsin-like peptidase domain-containing protein [Gaiellaceae bacterium]|nr:trypsin-like peptidase domain-containing protein [Gaiellaceae bacterium]